MITRSTPSVQPVEWGQELKLAYTDPRQLLRDLGIPDNQVALGDGAGFAFRVPRPFASRMRPGDAADPLLRQVLPLAAEAGHAAGFTTDPVADLASRRGAKVLQKYHGRALLMLTGACAINCRYCFRRHYPYAGVSGGNDALLGAVRADATISELILSGGDPLMLRDDALARLIDDIAAIGHVRRLRIHTRLPVTIPSRLTPALIDALTRSRLTSTIVVHINHPNEIDAELHETLRTTARAGIPLLNQSVLLRGINDDPNVLARLSESLFDAAVLPYYIHLLDPVQGAAHFDVDETTARGLARILRDTLPGYLVPRFAREVPGASAKHVIA
jgi:EF-P beta-lysylation protein EpmB